MGNAFQNETYVHYNLVNCAAPVWEKRKPAGLMTIWKNHLGSFTKNQFRQMEGREFLKGSKLEILLETKFYFLLLCYQEEAMEKELEINKNSKILEEYKSFIRVQEHLGLLKYKLKEQYLGKAQFPHEIGLFLGYPIWDVEGFVAHKGQDYKLCGYWKVYDDVPGAIQRFEEYDWIRKTAKEHFYKEYERNNQKI